MRSITRSGGGGRSRREAVERDVFDAVERLLGDGESFTALGVQRIADEAKIARTTFYGHFPDKPTLLIRMTEAVTADLFQRAADWVQRGGTRDELADTILSLVGEQRRHAPLLRALAEVASYEREVEAFWHARIEAFADVIRERLERDHQPDESPDPVYIASWIAWGTERTIAVHVATRPPGADHAFAQGVAHAIWATMQRPAA
jgi:AcrR family transcriptional regulator